jgi:hypothetical protein
MGVAGREISVRLSLRELQSKLAATATGIQSVAKAERPPAAAGLNA